MILLLLFVASFSDVDGMWFYPPQALPTAQIPGRMLFGYGLPGTVGYSPNIFRRHYNRPYLLSPRVPEPHIAWRRPAHRTFALSRLPTALYKPHLYGTGKNWASFFPNSAGFRHPHKAELLNTRLQNGNESVGGGWIFTHWTRPIPDGEKSRSFLGRPSLASYSPNSFRINYFHPRYLPPRVPAVRLPWQLPAYWIPPAMRLPPTFYRPHQHGAARNLNQSNARFRGSKAPNHGGIFGPNVMHHNESKGNYSQSANSTVVQHESSLHQLYKKTFIPIIVVIIIIVIVLVIIIVIFVLGHRNKKDPDNSNVAPSTIITMHQEEEEQQRRRSSTPSGYVRAVAVHTETEVNRRSQLPYDE